MKRKDSVIQSLISNCEIPPSKIILFVAIYVRLNIKIKIVNTQAALVSIFIHLPKRNDAVLFVVDIKFMKILLKQNIQVIAYFISYPIFIGGNYLFTINGLQINKCDVNKLKIFLRETIFTMDIEYKHINNPI